MLSLMRFKSTASHMGLVSMYMSSSSVTYAWILPGVSMGSGLAGSLSKALSIFSSLLDSMFLFELRFRVKPTCFMALLEEEPDF